MSKRPWPNPESEQYDNWKQKRVRLWSTLLDTNEYLDGKLVWVSLYTLGLEIVDLNNQPKRLMINKGAIARIELSE